MEQNSMSLEQLQERRNFEQNTLVWLNENRNDSENVNQIQLKLRRIINYVKIFENVNECVDYISSNENEQIYFIISPSLSDLILPFIYEIEQIKFIYIFSLNKQYYGKLAQIFDKVSGTFTDPIVMCDALRRDISLNKTTVSATYNSSTLLLSALPSSINDRSNQQEAAFMYFRLLAETLVKLDHKQSIKDEFISICRSQYQDNTRELEKIEEFSQVYSKEHAIHWYTRDSFLYRILNNALRTQDIDILFKLGFFIADLYNQLQCLHSEQSKLLILPSVVYRGQFMTKTEFDNKIKNNIGGFLSINSFFSTSTNKQVALMFAGNSSSNDPNIESVLFEISIDNEKCRQPVADIKRMTYMEEEDEILFSMASVFRIESVDRLHSEDIWMVRLVMNGEEDEELNALSSSIKEEIGEMDNLSTFCDLLMKMGDLQKAEYYMLMLIKDTQADDLFTLAQYYSVLSLIYSEQMNYDAALSYAEKALRLQPFTVQPSIGLYTNLALSYVNKNDSVQAFHYFQKTLDVCKGILPSNHLDLAPTYMNLGILYIKQKDFLQALEYFLKVIDIFQNSFSTNHPKLAIVYNHIGHIYLLQNDYSSALFYYQECLRIQERSLPQKHPHLISTYGNIGIICLNQFDDVEACKSFEKILEIIDPSLNHPYLPKTMCYLGQCHERKNNITEALNFFHKALDAQLKLTASDHTLTVIIYRALGILYGKQNDWVKMIACSQKGIPIAISCNHTDLVLFYNMIAFSYSMLDDYESACQYVELALDVGRRTLPSNHSYIQMAEAHKRLLNTDANSTHEI